MKSLVVFMLLINYQGGEQVIAHQTNPMSIEECDVAQKKVWAMTFETVEMSEEGPVPMIDAACVPALEVGYREGW
jgi:hypothetical protein